MTAIILGGKHPSQVMDALAEGCASLGHRVRSGWKDVATGDDIDGQDLVLVWGMAQIATKEIVRLCHAQQRPVIIFDLPLLRWLGTHAWDHGEWVGLYRQHVGQAWDTPCTPARLTQLGIAPTPTKTREVDSVLLIGQVPHDASHALGLQQYAFWLQDTATAIHEQTGATVYWRPHPRASTVPCPTGCIPVDNTVSLHEQLHEYGSAVTLSSAAQYVAYLEGVPVTVTARGETWPEFAGELAPVERLAQASWNQWTLAELASGDAIRTMLEGPPASRRDTDAPYELPRPRSVAKRKRKAKVA